jgi:CRISPR-associated endoribonuclease Cas6
MSATGIPSKSYSFSTASFRFRLEARELLMLPSYKGSTLRGGFGYTFKRVVCAIRGKECSECLLKEKCIYSYVFETPPRSDTRLMRKYRASPHPFVIEPPLEDKREYKPGEEILFGLILIGRAVDYLPYFIYTFDEMGKIGIGKGRGRFLLSDVSCGDKIIYDSKTKILKPFLDQSIELELPDSCSVPKSRDSQVSLLFLTPTRIVYEEHLTLDLEFHVLIRNLLRRLSLLYYFHCGGDPSAWDFRGTIERAKKIRVDKRNLRWYEWERYSARQDTRMKMGGFVGEIIIEGNIEPFLPLLRAGEVFHVGKGTSFGLGMYSISS